MTTSPSISSLDGSDDHDQPASDRGSSKALSHLADWRCTIMREVTNHRGRMLYVCTFITAFEYGIVGYYFFMMNEQVTREFDVPTSVEATEFRWWIDVNWLSVFVIGVAGLMALTLWMLKVMVSTSRWDTFLSWDTLVQLITVPLMVVGAGLALYSSGNQEVAKSRIPSSSRNAWYLTSTIYATKHIVWVMPLFLRVWCAQPYVSNLAFYLPVTNPIRSVILQVIFILHAFITAVGVNQLAETIQAGQVHSFVASSYFTLVTVATIGFGDIVPSGLLFRLAVMSQVFVAILLLPLTLSQIADIADYLEKEKRYTLATRHVIIFSKLFSSDVFRLFCAERLSPDNEFRPLNLVLVATEFSAEIREVAESTDVARFATLCLMSSQGTNQVVRFAPRRAIAALLITRADGSFAQRGDFDTLRTSMVLHRVDPELPQVIFTNQAPPPYFTTTSSKQVSVRHELFYDWAGSAARLPGMARIILSMIRSPPAATSSPNTRSHSDRGGVSTGGGCWWTEYIDSLQQSVYLINTPEELAKRTFESAALILFLRVGLIAIGIVRQNLGVKLHPGAFPLHDRDRLVVIAPGLAKAKLASEQFSSGKWQDKGGSAARQHYIRRNEGTQPAATAGLTDDGDDDGATRGHDDNNQGATYPFHNHVVVIDVAEVVVQQERFTDEVVKSDRCRAAQLARLTRYFPNLSTPIVYLAAQSLGPVAELTWGRAKRSPVYHVSASTLSADAIRRCCVFSALSVIIVNLADDQTDTVTVHATMTHVQGMVMNLLRKARALHVPTMVVRSALNLTANFEPVTLRRQHPDAASSSSRSVPRTTIDDGSSDVTETWRDTTELSLSVATCSVLCMPLLDVMPLRSVFLEELPDIIRAMLRPGRVQAVKAESLLGKIQVPTGESPVTTTNAENTEELNFFSAFRQAASLGLLPIGLWRLITTSERGAHTLGFRYFVLNPPRETRLRPTDIVYLINPGNM